ncbi:MAG TPA: hypothetical protein VKA19_00075 [Alphaproteobacteria bacterium]|nr:hypothetical protein [Alphaproteobacteria bacterium]
MVALLATLTCGVALVAGAAVAEAAQSHPDLSGVWVVFQNSRTGGRFGMPAGPKLSERGKKMVADFKAKYDVKKYEPGAYCVPDGMPTEMFGGGSYPFEIIQQPKRITLLNELEMQVRRIYMDGRGHPKDFPHTRGGHSIAHWDGDTLVVDTALLKAWPIAMWPHSDEAHIVERISLKKRSDVKITTSGFLGGDVGNIILVDELTMTDPIMYDGPQKITLYARKLDQKETLEYDCTEGNWWTLIESTAKKK